MKRGLVPIANLPRRDPLEKIMANLDRASERDILQRLSKARIDRLPECETKEELLDLRSQARKHINSTLKV